MNITIAITGASGTIYAQQLIQQLQYTPQITQISLVLTKNAQDVAIHELGTQYIQKLTQPKTIKYDNNNLFTPIASGSAANDAMVIIPCSMGMAARIANGISNDLISRAADVTLKERRKLIIVTRETPLSIIHLKNLTTLTEAGAIILPASPSFYHHPSSIEELIMSTTERILQQLQIIKTDSYQWKKSE